MKKKIDLSDLIQDNSKKKKTAKKKNTKAKPDVKEEPVTAGPVTETKPSVETKAEEKPEKKPEKKPEPAAEQVKALPEQDDEEISIISDVRSDERETDDTREFVSFLLSEEEYGIDSDFVRQIIKYKKPLDVGIKSELIFGVLNLKDGVLPLVDFRNRFNLKMKERKDGSIIILDLDDFKVGIYVDYLIGIVRLQNTDVKTVPSFLPEKQMAYIQGAGLKKDSKIIIILDQYRLFNDTDVRELKSVPERYK